MIKVLALVAALLAPLAARAADTIAITVVSDVPGASGTLANEMTFTQGDMAQFIAWAQANFTCSPVAPATTCAALTLPQVIAAWAAMLEKQTAASVNAYLQNNAASAAAAAVVPVAPN